MNNNYLNGPLAVHFIFLSFHGGGSIGEVHPRTLVTPGADFDWTGLLIKWKVCNVYITGGGEHSTGLPVDIAVRRDQHADLFELLNDIVRSEKRSNV